MRKLMLIALSLFALPALSAELWLTEFTGAPPTVVTYQAAKTPALRETTVPVTEASVMSLVFTASTGLVRIQCDVICHVQFGTSPSATEDSARLVAGQTEYFVVTPGQRLAVVAGAAP